MVYKSMKVWEKDRSGSQRPPELGLQHRSYHERLYLQPW
mgnify:CR=1 FL=1